MAGCPSLTAGTNKKLLDRLYQVATQDAETDN